MTRSRKNTGEESILTKPELKYEALSNTLSHHQVGVDVAEIQGVLCGMLAGGMNVDDRDWLKELPELINGGESFHKECVDAIIALYDLACQEFIEPDFALTLMLPDDASPINERGLALVSWVHGFLLGFGLHQADLTKCSDEVKEALYDFSQIVRMDEEMQEDEETEKAFFEVVEYVRISAMLCFNELGKSLLNSRHQQDSVVH